MASDLREVKAVVEQLLGLTYDDFTQAVVLPQGRFAEFLSATPAARQDILLKLLGADQYEQIRKVAAERQRDAESRVGLLDAQLAELTDATADAEAAASARVSELDALRGDIDERMAAMAELREVEQSDARRREGLERDVARLTAVRAPDGVADLRQRAEKVSSALDAAELAESAAADRWDAARAALEKLGPRREWERLAEQWSESAELAERIPGLREAAEAATTEMKAARDRRDEAVAAARAAEQAVEDAAREQEAAEAAQRDADSRRDVLVGVNTPTGVRDLADQVAVAAETPVAQEAALDTAERADGQARTEAAAIGDGSAERRALEWLEQRRALLQELAALDSAAARAGTALEAAQAATSESEQAFDEAERRLQAARDHAVAASLRTHLAVGDECPVCERRIDVLPVSGDSGDLTDAQAALDAARDHRRAAILHLRLAEKEATQAATLAGGKRDSLADVETRIAAAHPDADADSLDAPLRERLSRVEAAAAALEDAGARVREARKTRQDAAERCTALQATLADGWRQFRAARAPLLLWGCPTQEPSDLAVAWDDLSSWARQQRAALDEHELPALRSRCQAAAQALAQAGGRAASARACLEQAEAAATEATKRETSASGEMTRAEERARVLAGTLLDRPDAAAAAAALERLAEAEAAEKQARSEHGSRREELRVARAASQEVQAEMQLATRALRAARDPLVALGAPPLDEDNPGSGWDTLVTWAACALTRVSGDLGGAREAEAAAAAAVARAEAGVVARCEAAQLTVPNAAVAPTTIAGALADARTHVSLVQRRIAKRAQLDRQRAESFEQAQVASLLAESLKANKFQKWLAGAALDVLVEAASETLHELSGGQYGLTHDRGDFFVIDHEDAEARRSVRTLSGGETFQTSLALALALSDQLSSLSSNSARLESLFLDEGFGTLDAASLETVALTLERLAQGERMVGVVTHVPALAERVPTRFVVTRDSQSSRVVREG